MNDELKKLFEGSDLSDEFKSKVAEIFEAALDQKLEEERSTLEEQYEQKAKEYSEYVVSEMEDKTEEYIQSELLPMVEKYLDFSVQEHFKSVEPVVESQIKVELADNFLKGFVSLAEGYNVSVSDGQDSLVEKLEKKLEQMQSRFDTVLQENVELKDQIVESKMTAIVDQKVSNLTESQKEKFFNSAKRVKFQDEDQYTKAIDELYESYFPVEDDQSKTTLKEKTDNREIQTEVKVKDTWLDAMFSKI